MDLMIYENLQPLMRLFLMPPKGGFKAKKWILLGHIDMKFNKLVWSDPKKANATLWMLRKASGSVWRASSGRELSSRSRPVPS